MQEGNYRNNEESLANCCRAERHRHTPADTVAVCLLLASSRLTSVQLVQYTGCWGQFGHIHKNGARWRFTSLSPWAHPRSCLTQAQQLRTVNVGSSNVSVCTNTFHCNLQKPSIYSIDCTLLPDQVLSISSSEVLKQAITPGGMSRIRMSTSC